MVHFLFQANYWISYYHSHCMLMIIPCVNMICNVQQWFDAVCNGKWEKLEVMIQNGIDINKTNSKFGYPLLTALDYATRSADISMVRFLVKHGAIIDHGTGTTLSPLSYALQYCNIELVQHLLDHSSSIHYTPNALNIAATRNCSDILQLVLFWYKKHYHLLRVQHNGDHADYEEKLAVALGHAVHHRRIDNVILLLAAKANVDHKCFETKGNATELQERAIPLCQAVAQRNKDLVNLLISYGADVNCEHSQYSPLTTIIDTQPRAWCLSRSASGQPRKPSVLDKNLEDIMVLLLSNGANPCQPNSLKNLGFLAQVISRHLEHVVGYLLQNGYLSKHAISSWINHEPILNYAAAFDSTVVVDTLIAAGADVQAKDMWDSRTALFSATYSGNVETVKTLVKAGAVINIQDDYGFTPFTFTIDSRCFFDDNHFETLRFLILAGYDPNIGKERFETNSLVLCAKKGFTLAIEVLLECGMNVCNMVLPPSTEMNIPTDMCDHIRERTCMPLSLQGICRSTIRQSMKLSASNHAEQLPIPKHLINFVTLKHIEHFEITDNMYTSVFTRTIPVLVLC